MTKAFIFDLFGVIITDALEGIVAEMKVTEPKKAAQIVTTVTDANRGLILPEVSRSTVASILGLSTDEYKQRIRDGEVKDRELLNYITSLRPRYKTALLTNIIKNGLDVRFTPNELSTYFDAVVASCDIGYAKPEARAYEITADRLGVRLDECIMIDDRENYCLGATGVGMRAVQYQSYGQMKHELERLIG